MLNTGFKRQQRKKFSADVDLEKIIDRIQAWVLKVSADVPIVRCIRHKESRAIDLEYTQAERTPRLAGCGASQ